MRWRPSEGQERLKSGYGAVEEAMEETKSEPMWTGMDKRYVVER